MLMYALIGSVRAYSPVPVGDIWDGYIDFFLRAMQGGWSPWLEAHNEHRIVLSRLLPLAAGLVLLGLMSWQLRAIRNKTSMLYARRLGALALATQMNDPSAIEPLYPPERTPHVLSIADRASQTDIPAFGRNAALGAIDWLGRRLSPTDCQTGIGSLRVLAAKKPQARIDGHLKHAFSQYPGEAALMVDERDIIAGWALVRSKAARERGDGVNGPAFSGFVADLEVAIAGWTTTSLRICPVPISASFAYSE